MILDKRKTYKFSYDKDGNKTPRLKWIGKSGCWNMFVKDDNEVWAELLDRDLHLLVEVE